jgi:hypothetical protein
VTSMPCIAIAIALMCSTVVQAATINVRRDGTGDYATIQPALDAAADGDTILIGPGEYTEATMVRLPGSVYEIQSYADIRCDNLTIIGAGAESTVIGPAIYLGNAATGDPAGLSYGGGGVLNISDIGIRHCYTTFVLGVLHMDRCHLSDNTIGLWWEPSGSGGWVRDSVVEVTEPIFDPASFDIGYGGLGSGITLERNSVGNTSVVRAVNGMTIRDCSLSALHIYAGARAYIERCSNSAGGAGILLSMGSGNYCNISDSELGNSFAALQVSESSPGGRFVVENSRLEGGSYGVLWLQRYSGPCEVHHCDLIKGTGPVVRCDPSGPTVTHNMSDNYWGTTDEATLQSWIIDHGDNPQIGGTVLYSPFAGQSVPAESTTWSDLKVLFR